MSDYPEGWFVNEGEPSEEAKKWAKEAVDAYMNWKKSPHTNATNKALYGNVLDTCNAVIPQHSVQAREWLHTCYLDMEEDFPLEEQVSYISAIAGHDDTVSGDEGYHSKYIFGFHTDENVFYEHKFSYNGRGDLVSVEGHQIDICKVIQDICLGDGENQDLGFMINNKNYISHIAMFLGALTAINPDLKEDIKKLSKTVNNASKNPLLLID